MRVCLGSLHLVAKNVPLRAMFAHISGYFLARQTTLTIAYNITWFTYKQIGGSIRLGDVFG